MRTRERLLGIKQWVMLNLCAGRSMKAPGQHIGEIVRAEPRCFLVWQPSRPNLTGESAEEENPISVCPSITLMINPSKGKAMEEKRFDRYNNVRCPKELGQTLAMSMLFCIYEPGVRLPGFVDSIEAGSMDLSLIEEGTEEGLFTLTDWIDEAREKLLAAKTIPGTDLFLDEESIYYSLYSDQSFVVDKRPIYYGFLNFEFGCYADEGRNEGIEKYLL